MKETKLQNTKTKNKVLIVEDEGEMCLLLNILLHDEQFDLDHVQNISRAMEYLEKENPPVVILDNKLPDGFGIDFISYIRKNYPDTRIIMMSGYEFATEQEVIDRGANLFLKKPFTRSQIYNAITAVN